MTRELTNEELIELARASGLAPIIGEEAYEDWSEEILALARAAIAEFLRRKANWS